MANNERDLLGDFGSNNEHFSTEDFEELDKPDQDEEVTTTSFTGESTKPEEDRYQGIASQNFNFDEDKKTETPQGESLISFGSPSRNEPSAPPASKVLQEKQEKNLDDDLFNTAPKTNVFMSPESVQSAPSRTLPESGAWLKNVDPRVVNLVYWRDVKKTGVVFGSMLFLLFSLACCSVLSVLAYLSLALLTVTLSFRVYKNVLQAVQKSGEGHPFRQYLDMDIDLPEEKAKAALGNILKHLNCTVRELRRLFLIEDIVDSLKFGLLLWVMTYIGSWFNGMTLIILAVVAIFTLPKFYETYKVQIDNYMNMACSQINSVMKQIQEKVPFLKKKEKTQ